VTSSILHAVRENLASPIIDLVWSAEWQEIQDMEVLPGCPMASDHWQLPDRLFRKSQRGKSETRIDFDAALGEDILGPNSEAAIRRAKRIAVLLATQSLLPERAGKGNRPKPPPTPPTFTTQVKGLLHAMRRERDLVGPGHGQDSCPDGRPIFRDLPPACLKELISGSSSFAAVANRLSSFYRQGLFDDWPDAHVRGPRRARDREVSTRPYTDDDLTQIIRFALAYSDLSDDLTKLGQKLRSIPEDLSVHKASRLRQEIIDRFAGDTLTHGYPLAFPMTATRGTPGGRVTREWGPGTTYGTVQLMISAAQAANAVLILISTAMRKSELLHLERDCLTCTTGVLKGITFKSSDRADGEIRNWPINSAARFAVERQMRLADALAPDTASLWVRTMHNNGPEEIPKIDGLLVETLARITDAGGAEIAIDGAVNMRRFRTSTSRLIGLSLTGAVHILFDVLGHDDPTISRGYMTSDPNFVRDLRKVAEEVHAARARDILSSSRIAGGAAPAIDKLREVTLPAHGPNETGADSIGLAGSLFA